MIKTIILQPHEDRQEIFVNNLKSIIINVQRIIELSLRRTLIACNGLPDHLPKILVSVSDSADENRWKTKIYWKNFKTGVNALSARGPRGPMRAH